MKNMKKIFALVISVLLVMSMLAVGYAANDKTITVKNANPGQSYTLYKIFDATVNAARAAATDADEKTEVTTSGINYTLPTGKSLTTEYTYTDAAGTSHTVKGADWFTVDSAGNITANNGADITTEAFREWAKKFGTQIETKTNNTDAAADLTFTGLADGYYFMTTTTGSLVTVTSVAPNAIIKDKNGVPTVEKVEDEPTNDIGDRVNYTVTVHLQPGTKNVKFHDELSAGLTLQGTAPTTIKVGNDPLTAATSAIATTGDYFVEKWENSTATGDDITIAFTQRYLDSLTAATDVTITYSALVNENAVVNEHNDAYLKYGENNNIESEHITVWESTFKFKVNKVDGSNNNAALNGAKFVLSTSGDLGDLKETFATDLDATQLATLLKFTSSGTQDQTNGSYELTANNNITFNGLDGDATEGTIYYLYETKAPDGYNKLTAPVAVKITPVMNADQPTKVDSYTVAYKLPGDSTFTDCAATNDFAIPQEFNVQNNQGTLLPSTGGIGTTIFYIAGSILVLAAVIFLVTKRRMGSEE
jgi:fimbrial isopeptide formation D2 family protein/LPXTG-motif cell wall-anchored protein